MTPEEIAERQAELKDYWFGDHGFRQRNTIEMFPLPEVSDDEVVSDTLITATSDTSLRNTVEVFARYFKRELKFDFVPFSTDWDEDQQSVYLIKAQRVLMLSPVSCGAVGFDAAENRLMWVWLHPFERGKHLMENVWHALELVHGGEFTLEAPISPAMERFLIRQKVAPARWNDG